MSHATVGYAAHSAEEALKELKFERRALRKNDVAFEVLYCGVCHTDLHQARNDWGSTQYPVVPGHEIVGRVEKVGSDVKKFKKGDTVAVGCMVDSCLSCDQCHRGQEQCCRKGNTQTYNSPDRETGDMTMGGYSTYNVVREEFCLRVPEGLDIKRAAPLLCAGVTTYSPLRKYNVGPGSRVGVVGLGGLGHMAVKLAAAMGAHVTVISRSDAKKKEAGSLGSDSFLVSKDEEAMKKAASSFDLIVDTVPVKHDVNDYLPLLDVDATIVMVGQIGMMEEINTAPMVTGRRSIAGSLIGGIPETQELLDFCAKKNILPECEMIRMQDINTAFDRMQKSDVRYRFVIDMQSLKEQ
ncbi:NADP-dependent alcohol dehydrogenase C 1 [Diplonema papillatum]|nr:NADP-dependent alcohol dehydrogenase C 1 [Diplonema papillatum]KAJ9471518.1 NADP-dependent alcohol dehydrogenase C 1 [Diplonema papillatum]KAJ9471519.1 NADP-dependent alcohol dehydrogenase C 1 [Diplonema papillatum]